jgi:hypothetical protein
MWRFAFIRSEVKHPSSYTSIISSNGAFEERRTRLKREKDATILPCENYLADGVEAEQSRAGFKRFPAMHKSAASSAFQGASIYHVHQQLH